MHAVVIGTRGQLATELHREHPAGVVVAPPERVDIAGRAELHALLNRVRPGVVVNAAAYTAVDKAESEPDSARAVNRDGPVYLAEWCSAHDVPLIHVSTDYVFDGRKPGPYNESDATAPLGVYGASKLAGEDAIRSVWTKHIILRTSWVFSAHGHNFVKTMLRLARERDELRIVADQFGRPTAARDLARAIWHLVERLARNEPVEWGIFHFAGHGPTSWHAFAEATVREAQSFTRRLPRVVAIATKDYPTPAQRPANSVLDTSRFEVAFRFSPSPWLNELRRVLGELSEIERRGER